MKLIKVLEGETVYGKKRKKVVIDFSRVKAPPGVSIDERIEDLKLQDELEMFFQLILNKIEFDLVKENSGIGSYQIGSSNEFDAGEDYLTIKDENTKVYALIILGEVSSIAARNILRDACLTKRTLSHNDLAMDVKFVPVMSFDGKGFISYKIGVGE